MTEHECIAGRNAVAETLKSGRPCDALFIAQGETKGLGEIISLAKSQGLAVKDAKREKLAQLCGHAQHQGVVLTLAAQAYAEVDDLFARAAEKGELPFFVICDEIEDPYNLGAIIRTAEGAGAHGVIVPKRRSAPLSQVVARASAGAIAHLPVARVANIAQTLEELKARGLWIYGADMQGECYTKAKLDGAIALVIGSEGQGIGRLVKERCDVLLSLPMNGKIDSLNASVAAGILLYEVMRWRVR